MEGFKQGFQVFALPASKGVWQIALFVLGHEVWQQWPEDHDSEEYSTWYIQFLHWQFSYTKEMV